MHCQEREWSLLVLEIWYTASLFSGSHPVKESPQQGSIELPTTSIFHPLATTLLFYMGPTCSLVASTPF
ncbi:hypothetical protein DSO57_1025234 [Entomophthora muscae]|uniref:Uncharacterized protein n=1 Tax=Entomophthora muscae TaxID=34485 RepID=A0ACC2SF10_9FUNG|nr:hypothetical protein DSO57_1025234 [Entomophthora muscae]